MTTDVDATWLLGQRRLLRRHVSSAVHPDGGFAWLGSDNRPRLDRPVELWISARMTYVAALSVLEGDDTLQDPLAHGVTALDTVFRDPDHEGWFAAVSHGRPTTADKRAYEHAFVVLASAGAAAAGAPGGPALLDEALTTFETRFWRDTDGLVVDVWDRTWSTLEPYRGVNANMHTVEALLTASDVTGEARWARYAVRIVERVVHDFAAGNDYRLPEHFTSDWVALPDYNRDEPAHPFRPYGVTIGHLLEWSRLTLQTRDALADAAPPWMLPAAVALFRVAVRDGWWVDGRPGFVYTTDFDGVPVVRDRLHWVVAEGIGAAWALHEATGDPAYLEHYQQWWAHAQGLFIDPVDGSWQHELNPSNEPASSVWDGRPDVYHAYQAALLPSLRRPVSFAGALLREGPPSIL